MQLDLPVWRSVDPAALDSEALRMTAKAGTAKVVSLLLELPPQRGVNAAADNNGAFRLAAEAAATRCARRTCLLCRRGCG